MPRACRQAQVEGTLLPSQVDQFLKELGQQRLELQAQIEVTLQSSRQREMSQRELEDERDDLERQIRKLQRDIDRARENKGGRGRGRDDSTPRDVSGSTEAAEAVEALDKQRRYKQVCASAAA